MYALSLAIGIHKLLELGCIFDFEENFLAVLNKGWCTWLLTLRLSCSGGGGAVVICPINLINNISSNIKLEYLNIELSNLYFSMQCLVQLCCSFIYAPINQALVLGFFSN